MPTAPKKMTSDEKLGDNRAVLDLVMLSPLMARTRGRSEIVVGLIDGPVAIDHRELADAHIRNISNDLRDTCMNVTSTACRHATFIAGILSAKRSSPAPAICPDCTLLTRSVFTESRRSDVISSTPGELAQAIFDCIAAGARVINLSLALIQSHLEECTLREALDYAVKRGVIIVAAAGNQGMVGSTLITQHRWVIPVAACDLQGRPSSYSNFGNSIGRYGLQAPGNGIISLSSDGHTLVIQGTSVAAPIVTGAIALLWSSFPTASAAQIKFAATQMRQRSSVIPPLLDAWQAFRFLEQAVRDAR